MAGTGRTGPPQAQTQDGEDQSPQPGPEPSTGVGRAQGDPPQAPAALPAAPSPPLPSSAPSDTRSPRVRAGWWPSLHASPGETGEPCRIRLRPFHYSGARAGQSGGKTGPRAAPAMAMPTWGSVSTPPGTRLSRILQERLITSHQTAAAPARSPGRNRRDQLCPSLAASHPWGTRKRIFLASGLQERLGLGGTGWKPLLRGAEVRPGATHITEQTSPRASRGKAGRGKHGVLQAEPNPRSIPVPPAGLPTGMATGPRSPPVLHGSLAPLIARFAACKGED